MPFRPCPSGCGRFLSADDGHDRCLQCLGRRHAEAAFVDDSCVCCGRMSFTSSEDEGAVGLPPSGVVATAAPDPELTAMLARAAVSIGLEVNRPPSPEPSRLDDWFLGAGRGSQPRPAPVPFFPEVHEELTSSWMAPFTARSRSSASSVLTTLDGGVARGYAGIPQVERAVAVHLCPRNAATWRNRPRLPSKACKLTASSRPKLTVLRARQPPPCTPWLSCRFTKPRRSNRCTRVVPTRGWCRSCARRLTSLYERRKSRRGPSGRRCPPWWSRSAISGSTWQRWRTSTRHAFSTPPSPREGCSATPSRASPSSSRRYSSRPRRSSTSCPGVMHHPPLPPGPGLSLPVAVGALLRPPEPLRPRPNRHIGRRVEPLAGERRPPRPSQAPSRPGSRRSGPDAGNPEMLEFALSQETARTAPLLPPVEGREENLLFCFVSVPPLVQGPAVPTFSKKEQFPFPPGSQVHGTTVCDALPPHSRPRPILPVAKRVRFGDDIPPHAPLASPVRDPGSSVRMPQNAPPSVPSTPTPFCCTTTGTSIVPLEPLAQRLEAWLTLPSLSRWLTRTIRLGYAIQFARRPPKFNGVLETSVAVRNAPVLREEIAVLLAKDAIEPVPPAEMRQGFYSPYFIVPKKGGGLRPILDLRVLNRALHKLPFKMLTHRRMIKCIQPQDWFAAIDLKDAYFHVSILPRRRPFQRFAFEGRAWQYRVLPFGLSLSPRVFTKVVEGALTPLREVGVRILNYLDDWLILAQSREQLGDHRDLVLRHLSQLGLRVNWEKSKLSPVQRISFLGVELDSVSMTARLTEERAQAVLNCLSSFRGRNVVPLKQFQRLLGHMASAAAVTPLGLLHMRPLQHWLHSRVPRWAWRRGTLRVGISQQCRRSLSPWTDLAFLRAGVPLEQVSRHTVVTTDASSTGWGTTCNGQAASGLWTGPRLLWHINCLELWAVHLALRQFRPLLLGKHVLVRTDNTAAVSYINRLGGIRSHRMSELARHLLLWSHTQFKSLRAVHIPGQLNRAADALSRQLTFPGEWRLHPETIRLIWSRFGEAQVDLFASPESSHCQLYFSLTEGPLGTDALAYSWPRALRKYAFPPVSLLAQTLCKLREDEEQVLLVAPLWPTRTWFPELISLATVPPWRIPLRKDLLSQGLGTIWHPHPDLWNLHVWLLDGTAVVETIIQARAPSTRQTYALKWSLFATWCSSRREDPRRCTIGVVLSFLQERLEHRLSPSTLKVYVAAIAAHHDAVDGRSLGKHDLIVRFLKGARRMNPSRPPLVPSWDLSIVLAGLQRGPFEPLDSVELKFLSLKTALLTVLTSIKRVGDLQAFSVSEECLVFGPVYSHVVLRPRPGYVPKVPTTPFCDQVVNLQALPSEEADPALALLCPVRALRIYVTRTRSVRSSEQLFVCHGGQQKGKAVSKQRLAHWIVEAVALAYQSQGEPCPLGVRAHSTRSVASSHALAHGASLADICRAAGWATPNTFARFYNLRVEPVSSRVLGKEWARRTGRCHACCAIPPHPGIRVPFSPPSSVPRTVNPGGILQAPPAVRLGGAVWRQAQYWC